MPCSRSQSWGPGELGYRRGWSGCRTCTSNSKADADSGCGGSGVLSLSSTDSRVLGPGKPRRLAAEQFFSRGPYLWLGKHAVIQVPFRAQPSLYSPAGLLCRSRPQTQANSSHLQQFHPFLCSPSHHGLQLRPCFQMFLAASLTCFHLCLGEHLQSVQTSPYPSRLSFMVP